MTGSEIRKMFIALKFHLVLHSSAFNVSVGTICTIHVLIPVVPSTVDKVCHLITHYLDFKTLIPVFSYIIVHDIILKFLCKRKIKLFT